MACGNPNHVEIEFRPIVTVFVACHMRVFNGRVYEHLDRRGY